jgi:hypothetical protein
LRAVRLFEPVDRPDVWMVKRGEHLGFACESATLSWSVLKERAGP